MNGADTFTVAEVILGLKNEEAYFRAAASRAYFAVYRRLVSHPRLGGFSPTGKSEDHKDLIEFMKQSTDQVVRACGHRIVPRLRALRNHADYRSSEYTKEQADEALEIASEIIHETFPLS